jgi:hypothetical protein
MLLECFEHLHGLRGHRRMSARAEDRLLDPRVDRQLPDDLVGDPATGCMGMSIPPFGR